MGRKARQFVINNFSVEVIGRKLEKIIDGMPEVNWDYNFEKLKNDPNYNPPNIKDDKLWLIDLYKNILKRDVDETDDGHKYWMQEISKGADRNSILKFFKKTATETNQKETKLELEDLLDKDDKGKRVAVVLPQSQKDVLIYISSQTQIA